MSELLFELGCEELPASFVQRAFEQLEAEITRRLGEALVPFGASRSMGTPRRLIVQVTDVAAMQPDQHKEVRGPAIKAAFDAEGNPTGPLLGFCKGQGVDPATVRREGDYVWIDKVIPGRPTAELLAEILPDAVRALNFDKSMRWGQARMRFARPIRWMVAVYGGQSIVFSVETVSSGNESRGHRFNHPDNFPVKDFDHLVKELRARQVEPDPVIRRQRIVEGAKAATAFIPDMSEALIDENTYLTEWPEALEGEFPADYLELPEPVLVTAMAKHERFFPVRDGAGKIQNRFISIRNGGEEATVRRGNAWVLVARFNDAKFFFDEDKRSTLADFLAKTERMTFQEKLGSIRQRADRLAALAASIGGGEDARLAGLYAKADLATGLVSELASLQGIVGGQYAAREGHPAKVCEAIAKQYDLGKISAEDEVAISLFVADQVDKLVGYLGQGIVPSGSSDPFGLRRAATQLIEIEWIAGRRLGLREALQKSHALYAEQGVTLDLDAALRATEEIFASRYGVLRGDVRYDILEAALGAELGLSALEPTAFQARLAELLALAHDTAFVQSATRPFNILAAATKKGIAMEPGKFDAKDLDSREGEALVAAARTAPNLKDLQAPINAFFDKTMVMIDDERVRRARLNMLAEVREVLARGGDWTKIVVEG